MFFKDLYSWPKDLEYHIYVENDLFIVYALKEIFQKVYLWVKLDGVGPVDNRPSTDKRHHFVQKKKK